jgi:hypothetical protein
VGRETRISVADDLLWEAEPSEYVFQVEFCYSRAGDRGGAGEKDRSSGTAMVYDSQNCIVSVTLWEARDKIHRYVREWFGVDGRGDTKQWGFDAVGQVLVLLTCGASFDVFCYPRPGARPEVFFVYASDCFISSGMAIEGSFVPCVHDLAFQPLVRGNDEAVFGNVSPE